MLLSWAFYEHGLIPPHVAAGINLAFWPFGSLARRAGAFFIRRSFKGDKIYSATLRAYVKYLLRERFTQEFFLEGGRSPAPASCSSPRPASSPWRWTPGATAPPTTSSSSPSRWTTSGSSRARSLRAGARRRREEEGVLRRAAADAPGAAAPLRPHLPPVRDAGLAEGAGRAATRGHRRHPVPDARRGRARIRLAPLARAAPRQPGDVGHRRGGDGHAGEPGGSGAPLPRPAGDLGRGRGGPRRAAPVHRALGERPDRLRSRRGAVQPDRTRPRRRRHGHLRRQQGDRRPGGGRPGHLPGAGRQAHLPRLPPQRDPEPIRRPVPRRPVGPLPGGRSAARGGPRGRARWLSRLFRLEFMYPRGRHLRFDLRRKARGPLGPGRGGRARRGDPARAGPGPARLPRRPDPTLPRGLPGRRGDGPQRRTGRDPRPTARRWSSRRSIGDAANSSPDTC